MGVERSVHCDSLEALHVPYKHHFVRVEGHCSHVEVVQSNGDHVRKLCLLVLCDLDFAVAGHDVRRAQGWRLAEADQVLQVVGGEHADYTV